MTEINIILFSLWINESKNNKQYLIYFNLYDIYIYWFTN